MANRCNTLARALIQDERALRGDRCQFDGSTVRLEWAHIKPTKLHGTGRGFHARVRDILRYPTHYLLLCYRCHQRLDHILARIT